MVDNLLSSVLLFRRRSTQFRSKLNQLSFDVSKVDFVAIGSLSRPARNNGAPYNETARAKSV